MIRKLVLILFTSCLHGQGTYTISTFAGGAGTLNGYTGDGGLATEARLNRPGGIALGRNGDLYISDTWNQAIRVLDASGKIHTIAGTGAQGFGGDGGPATQAKLSFPRGIAVDSHGNLYIADTSNNRIRTVTPDGIISTFAGTGERGYSGDGGPALNAKMNRPDGIAIGPDGVIYFTDSQNNMVRKITPDGMIAKVVGQVPIRKPGTDTLGPFDSPRGITVSQDGSLYVADRGHMRICKIDRAGAVTVVAGNGVNQGLSPTEAPGDGGPAIKADVPYPVAVSIDLAGNLLIAAGKIRRVDRGGIITTILGARLDGHPSENGDPLETVLTSAQDVIVDPTGNIFVADMVRHRILQMSSTGTVTTIAGLAKLPEETDGKTLRLSNSWGVAVGPRGDVFVADSDMNRIVRISEGGQFTRVAGKGVPIIRIEGVGLPPQFSGDGGPATSADLDYPFGITVDSHGATYISDSINNRVRKVTPDGLIETIAGLGQAGFSGDGGPATRARLSVLYEILTGKRTFEGSSPASVIAAILERPVPSIADVAPAALDRALQRCLVKDRDDRWQSARDLKAELEWIESTPESATAAPSRSRLGMGAAGRVAWGAAALFMLAFVAVSFVHFRETPPTEQTLRYTIAAPENGTVHSFAISPDGRTLVIAALVSGKRQLWLRTLDALRAQPMAFTDDAVYPFWSPDSRFIGFFAQGKLKKIAAGGGPAQSLCDVTGGYGGSWNRDDVIVFAPQFSGISIQRISANGGAPTDVTKTKGAQNFPVFLLFHIAAAPPCARGFARSLCEPPLQRFHSIINGSEFALPDLAEKGWFSTSDCFLMAQDE